MKVPYSFSVLRYVHDAVTQKFVNIGVVVFSPEAKYLRATCTTSYTRITNLFERIDGNRFRELTRHIQDQICATGREYETSLPFETGTAIEQMLARVLPLDDSALQFSKPGVGLSANLDDTLRELYKRHVEWYALPHGSQRRTNEDVWRVFRDPLDRADVTQRLQPKRIVAPDFEYEFKRSWKNGAWHLYEAVSFDYVDPNSIADKANRWLGRATSLHESGEPFKIHFLLGEPQDRKLKTAFAKAENILNKIPADKEFVLESQKDAFAEELASEIRRHPVEAVDA